MHKNLFFAVYISVGAIAAAVSSAAQAASYGDTSPIYAGVGVGRSNYKVNCYTSECAMHSKVSGKVYAGFSFAPMRAWPGSELTGSVELTGYFGGNAKLDSQASPAAFAYSATYSYRGAGVGYRLALRETEALSLHTKLGVAYLEGKTAVTRSTLPGRSILPGATSTALTGGLGVSYALNRQWSINAEYDLLNAKYAFNQKSRVHLFTVGTSIKF